MEEKVLIYAFLLQIIVLYGIIIYTRLSLLDPIPIFGFSWALNAFLLATNYLDFYQNVFTFKSFWIATFGIWMFVIGAIFAKLFLVRYKKFDLKNVDLSFLNSKKWMYLFEVFIFVYIVSIIFTYVNQGYLSFDLLSLREQHWDNYNEGTTGVLGVVRAVARSFAIIKFISLPFIQYVRYRQRHLIGAVVSANFLLLETFFEGGRGLFVYTFLTLIYLLIMTKTRGVLFVSNIFNRRNIKTVMKASWILVLAVYLLMVWFPKARNPFLVDNFEPYLSYGARASLSRDAERIADTVGRDVALPFYFALTYFTTPIPTLTFFFENTDFTYWTYLGAYNFPIFLKPIEIITSEKSSWLDIRDRIAVPLATRGFAINPWATGVRDLIIDFGVWGSLIFLFIFGFVCQMCYISVFRKPKIEMVLLMSQIVSTALFFGFHSSFFLGYVMYPIIILILIMIIRSRY